MLTSLSKWLGREQRAVPRYRMEFDVIYGVGDDLTVTSGAEISLEGISIRSPKHYPLGTQLEVRLFLDRDDPEQWIVADCVVTRSADEIAALHFRSLPRADRQKVEAAIRKAVAHHEATRIE